MLKTLFISLAYKAPLLILCVPPPLYMTLYILKKTPGGNLQKGVAAASTVLGSILLFGLIGHWMGNKTGSYKVYNLTR